jgi:hypothetical protein
MKTKKEHPVGDQVQDLITFFGHERLSVEDHFKDIDNFLLFKDFPDNRPQCYRERLSYNLLKTYSSLEKFECATVRMLHPSMGFFGEARLRTFLLLLINKGKVIQSKKRYKCKVSGTPAHYYMALPPAYWYENYLKP